MKYRFWLVAGVLTFIHPCSAAEPVELKDQKEKANYSIGYQIGGDFRRQGVAITPEILISGVEDALSGAESRMTDEEMRNTLVSLEQRTASAAQEAGQQAAQDNLASGEAFLAKNATLEGVTTLPSGLQYKVITAGKGPSPKRTDQVTVHYRGTLIDGTEFDSSYARNQPATFRLDRVIPGWTEGLQLMQQGARWQLYIPARLAYGESGSGERIPPNSALVFDVELIKVN
jgi:FKBP-type peptidyl-prolyl cis-trans isomerase FklB